MFEFPRAQKIAALAIITLVVLVTLIAVAVNSSDGDQGAVAPTPDPNATPTAVPVLERSRQPWTVIAESVRGASGTVAPVECPFVDERERETNNFLSLSPALTFVCDVRGLQATPIAPGRVVMRVTQAPLNSFKAELVANGEDGPWIRAATYGPFVAVDHGPLNGVGNVTTIYAGLDSINPELRVGQIVSTDSPLGSLGARMINGNLVHGVLTFELLTDDTRFGSDPLRESPGPASASAGLADALADHFTLPIATCNLPFGNPQLLVGATRDYRSGIHNGLDFNCGTDDHVINAAADGQVIFVVNDYIDATVEDREAVLDNAASAIDTPFWSLAMLYGNFVVMTHDVPSLDERVVSIYAHMTEVDPNILPGVLLTQGAALGTAGNRGTSTAAAGVLNHHSSLHLHWELHVNDRPVGYLQDTADTDPLYQQMLCSAGTAEAAPAC